MSGQGVLLDIVAAAVARRGALLDAGVPVRLVDDAGDNLPGVWIDRYGALAVIHVRGEDASDFGEFRALGPALAALCNVTTIYGRIHARRAAESAARTAELLFGEPVAEYWVAERGLEYLLRPAEQVNAGLFVDMRAVRETLQKKAQGLRVLNTFAFTGSLGLAALKGGATEVVQLDISKRILAWAKENYEHNAAVRGSGTMRFIAEDTRAFMDRELRRRAKGSPGYGLVILDPPSFGAGSGRAFRLADEYGALVTTGIELLGAGGSLLFTSNLRDLSGEALHRACLEAAHRFKREVIKMEPLLPPEDFTAPPESSTAMRGVWVTLK